VSMLFPISAAETDTPALRDCEWQRSDGHLLR
jgi:hypothetical protein